MQLAYMVAAWCASAINTIFPQAVEWENTFH